MRVRLLRSKGWGQSQTRPRGWPGWQSGNSTEPHLHFHVGDANSPLGGEGVPYALSAFEVQGRVESLQTIKMPWAPLATPERRSREMPLANVVVRFPEAQRD